MIAMLEGHSLKKVCDQSPGLYRLGDALSELLSLYEEHLEAADDLPVIVVEESSEELCSV